MIGFNLALFLLLAAASVSLASAEAAFYLTKRRRFGHLAINARADLASRYLDDPPSLLMPIQMGTYTAHVGMTIIITVSLLDLLAHWAMLVAVGVMAGYLLLCRLFVPYALARRNPERVLLFLLPAIHLYAQSLSPLVAALRRRASPDETSSADEAPAPEVPPPPVRDPDADRLEEALARFSTTVVRDVMTPRPDIVAIASTASVAELRRLMRDTKYSRIPVYGDNLDDIVGVIEIRDLVDFDGSPGDPLKPLSRPVFLVPETKKIADLLREMQVRRTPFAVVIDEYGGTAGLVSVEDIVEELVGEIKDEFDVETEPMMAEPDGSVLVAGGVRLDRLEQTLEAALGEGSEVETVGGLVTMLFERIPRAGERIEHAGFLIEVVDAERKRVSRVRFRRVAEPAPE